MGCECSLSRLEKHEHGAPSRKEDAAAHREALSVDHAINENRQDDWRGNSFKIKKVKLAIKPLLQDDEECTERILELAKNQHEY
jgi:alkanesulfonate monooxygenase SsuD/methylene tetrahydromethanopterin reductase-like flavin-dependent oxidoreductase (luciferase family)